MRIGIDAVALQNAHSQAGLYQYTHRLVSGLQELGDDHAVSLLFFNWRSRAIDNTIAQYPVGPSMRKQCCRVPFRLLEALDGLSVPVGRLLGEFDVFHGPAFRLPPGRYARRSVVTVHDLKFLDPDRYFPDDRAGADLFKRHTVDAVKRADAVVAVSQYTRADVLERLRCPPERLRVIYPGIGEEFRPDHDPDQIRRVTERYGVQGPYLLFVGFHEEKKNLLRVLDAFAQVRDHLPDRYQLVLAGPAGPATPALRARIEVLGLGASVVVPGQIESRDLPMLYAGARLFVFPSLHEGFGIPPLEAMASGVPVVASTAAALPEIVGPAAALADPTRTESIAEHLLQVLSDHARWLEMRTRGLQHAQRFSWHRMAQEVAALYQELA